MTTATVTIATITMPSRDRCVLFMVNVLSLFTRTPFLASTVLAIRKYREVVPLSLFHLSSLPNSVTSASPRGGAGRRTGESARIVPPNDAEVKGTIPTDTHGKKQSHIDETMAPRTDPYEGGEAYGATKDEWRRCVHRDRGTERGVEESTGSRRG